MARAAIFSEETGQITKGQYPECPAYGYDLRVSDMARFFNEAEKQKVKLNLIEIRLRDGLLNAGIMQKTRDEGTKAYTYIASGTAAIVSTGMPKKGILTHELNHAVYFTDPKYRNQITELYKNGFTADEKKLIDKIMGDMEKVGSYDFKNDKELFLTEFAAFFRDPNTLWTDYLKGLGYPESVNSEIQKISKKVKAKELVTLFYGPASDNKTYQKAGTAR